jgi:hypothetical protein
MYIFRAEKAGKQPYAQCGAYRGYHVKIQHYYYTPCPISRRIIAENILELVRHSIKSIYDYAKIDKTAFENSIRELVAAHQTDEVKAQQKRFTACKNRYGELEQLLNTVLLVQ